MKKNTTLTVILVDSTATDIAITHQNEWLPFRKRTVHIELTDEQMKMLEPRHTGTINGKPQFEVIGEVWLESEEKQ